MNIICGSNTSLDNLSRIVSKRLAGTYSDNLNRINVVEIVIVIDLLKCVGICILRCACGIARLFVFNVRILA